MRLTKYAIPLFRMSSIQKPARRDGGNRKMVWVRAQGLCIGMVLKCMQADEKNVMAWDMHSQQASHFVVFS